MYNRNQGNKCINNQAFDYKNLIYKQEIKYKKS